MIARFEIFAVTFAYPQDMRTSLEQQVLDAALRAKILECKFKINLKPFLAVQDLFTNITFFLQFNFLVHLFPRIESAADNSSPSSLFRGREDRLQKL